MMPGMGMPMPNPMPMPPPMGMMPPAPGPMPMDPNTMMMLQQMMGGGGMPMMPPPPGPIGGMPMDPSMMMGMGMGMPPGPPAPGPMGPGPGGPPPPDSGAPPGPDPNMVPPGLPEPPPPIDEMVEGMDPGMPPPPGPASKLQGVVSATIKVLQELRDLGTPPQILDSISSSINGLNSGIAQLNGHNDQQLVMPLESSLDSPLDHVMDGGDFPIDFMGGDEEMSEMDMPPDDDEEEEDPRDYKYRIEDDPRLTPPKKPKKRSSPMYVSPERFDNKKARRLTD